MVKIIEGDQNARGLRFGVVVSRFNDFVTSNLLTGALEVLNQYGVDEAEISSMYKNGILSIILPKAEEAKPKSITVAVE